MIFTEQIALENVIVGENIGRCVHEDPIYLELYTSKVNFSV